MDYLQRAKFFRTKKRLGQNFLINGDVISDIIEYAQLSKDDIVLEIGRIGNIIFGSALKAAGDATYTVVIAVVFMYLFAVLGTYVFGISLNWCIVGSWIALMMDECMRAILMGFRWKSRKWEQKVMVK